ncbi:hypothetical protein LTR84_004609 [Exophiala bonariae]|uniref:4a-hydroxytetrahydrobiopterin dehydratase n=1 Tax=Exophiala bonariae TaxID=1690606 RepID=A0AAV9NP07_9EURO|nr:hypothetical protein LTR84_004609 [Exophiala bonariae]
MLWHLTRQTSSHLLRHGHGHNLVFDSLAHHSAGKATVKDSIRLPRWQPCQRWLHLSPSNPIQISSDRRSITISLANGETITQQFRPTPKISSEKLQRALVPLLSDSGPQETQSASRKTSTETWHLDPRGDAIHRHFLFSSQQAREEAVQQIMQAAEDMKHHPHVARGGDSGGGFYPLTVTCTTHQPTGLSGKDTRLAARISELLLATTTPALDDHESVERIHEEQVRLIRINREAITKALESCGCSSAKAVS